MGDTFWKKFGQEFHPAFLAERLAEMAASVLVGLLVFFVFWVIARFSGAFFGRILRSSSPDRQDVLNLIAQTLRIAIYTIGGISALGTMGVNVSALVASLGLTGFALGFAFKDAVSNLLAGALILFYRPFGRGMRIAVTGIEGVVTAIDLRYTTLEADGKHFLIPNSNLLSNAITIQPNTPGPSN
jgi:small conductance mechanosensitive channel